MELILASQNLHKIREFRQIFAECGLSDETILSAGEVGLNDDVVEDGTSFETNALLKAAYPALNGRIGMADDSGLAVDALNGAPGIFSARYCGEHGNDEANNRKLLKEMENVPEGKRDAGYVCAIAVVWPRDAGISLPESLDASALLPQRLKGKVGPCLVVRGECRGEILREYRGQGGFGYDPLFLFPDLGKTFAEISPEEKNARSHRGKALRKLAEELKSL